MFSPEARRREASATIARTVPRQKSQVREYGEALFVALALALVIRTFVVQAFKIPSGSMLPTLQIGDHILVNKFASGPRFEIPLTQTALGQLPGLRKPRPGDVVVFIWPRDRSKDFIKRVVAVAGETIEIRDHQIFIDGKPRDDPHASWVVQRPFGRGEHYGPFKVPPGYVFVMGDNRDQSYDSRFWGPVPLTDVKGQAFIIYWSMNPADRKVARDRIW